MKIFCKTEDSTRPFILSCHEEVLLCCQSGLAHLSSSVHMWQQDSISFFLFLKNLILFLYFYF